MAAAPALRTPAQNRILWGLVSELQRRSGLSREDAQEVLRSVCREVSGQEHSSRLQEHQADRAITLMQGRITRCQSPSTPVQEKRKPWGPRGPGPRDDAMIQQRQQEVIQALFQQAGMTSREQQMGFCRRQCQGRPWPQSQADADALYEPLKAMVLRRVSGEDLVARVKALVGHKSLDAWKVSFIADLWAQIEAAKSPKSVLTTYKLLKLVECELAAQE